VQDLAKMTNTIAQTAVGLERIQTILSADDVIPEKPDAIAPPPLKGNIVFEHVAFGYEKDNLILRDVSFAVKPGQIIGVVGGTGSGKSTIVSLIPRFYDPTGGRVLIDGVDVRDYQLHPMRRQIGFVLQETVLFHGTIRDNIAYGNPGISTEDEVVAAAKLANADEFIARMPQGYDTVVGERGDTLSGGQRQRIGIARAIALRPRFVLADEIVSGLDVSSKAQILALLARLKTELGLTVAFISHDLSVVRRLCDRVMVMNAGRILENRPTAELFAAPEHPYTAELKAAIPLPEIDPGWLS
jgi:subfamily B ATP-binding cassette protein MsbA